MSKITIPDNSILLLEGGSLRGLFTAGVLDTFMENDVYFPAVAGVSAGSLNALNYASHQPGRSASINLRYRHDSRYFGPKAALRGGRSSDASYACAKAGILNLSKCFALAGAPFHITSNAVCPGNILTPMGKTLSWSKKDPKTYIPAGRYGTAEDIANAVLFYASDLSDYVTGDYMNVNGGLYM